MRNRLLLKKTLSKFLHSTRVIPLAYTTKLLKEGVVIQIKGTGTTKTFTVRKMSGNVGVERIIPFNSPYIHAIEVNKRGVVRRSRIFYFRELTGKKAKIKEKKF